MSLPLVEMPNDDAKEVKEPPSIPRETTNVIPWITEGKGHLGQDGVIEDQRQVITPNLLQEFVVGVYEPPFNDGGFVSHYFFFFRSILEMASPNNSRRRRELFGR